MAGKKKTRLAVLVSGSGSNLGAIIRAARSGRLKGAQVGLVISDRPHAYALVRARRAAITTVFIHPKGFRTWRSFEIEIDRHLKADKIDLVVLAGFMKILSPWFVKRWHNRILNIHPALLPSFKGAHAIRDALAAGVRVTGVTVHFVTTELDAGPIILQEPVLILDHDTEKTLLKRIHRVEHRLYTKAIGLVVQKKVKVRNGKVVFSR